MWKYQIMYTYLAVSFLKMNMLIISVVWWENLKSEPFDAVVE